MFSLKIEVEPNQKVLSPVWCYKLRLTTSIHLVLCSDEFRGPQSDTLGYVALVTTNPLVPEEEGNQIVCLE
ncbi:hypothetical protein TNCV_3302671 [Trichonephila clavipes]|nr:hypothetical protein TNCV_3302671 [Trichonephila clavipes]